MNPSALGYNYLNPSSIFDMTYNLKSFATAVAVNRGLLGINFLEIISGPYAGYEISYKGFIYSLTSMVCHYNIY